MSIEKQTSAEQIVFRPVVPGDQNALLKILTDAKQIKERNGDDAWGRRNFSPEEVQSLIANGGMFIGEAGDQPVATITLLDEDERIWGSRGLDNQALYIHKLARLGDYPGAGREAMKFAEQYAKSMGRGVLRLDNPMVLDEYYESLGFEAVDRLDLGDYQPTLREKQIDTQDPASS